MGIRLSHIEKLVALLDWSRYWAEKAVSLAVWSWYWAKKILLLLVSVIIHVSGGILFAWLILWLVKEVDGPSKITMQLEWLVTILLIAIGVLIVFRITLSIREFWKAYNTQSKTPPQLMR